MTYHPSDPPPTLSRRRFIATSGAALAAAATWGCRHGSDDAEPGVADLATAETAADLVVLNAAVFTSDPLRPAAEAFAVRDGRFLYVGKNQQAAKRIGARTRVVHAQGKRITPGFVDNHARAVWHGACLTWGDDLQPAHSFAQLAERVRRFASAHQEHPFVMGFGWRPDHLHGSRPTAALADTIERHRPLFLCAQDGLSGWVNTPALQLMQARNPEAFRQMAPDQDANTGLPTGLLRHFHAFSPFDFYTPAELGERSRQRMFESIDRLLAEALKMGVTTLQDAAWPGSAVPLLEHYRQDSRTPRPRIRGSFYVGPQALDNETGLILDLRRWREQHGRSGSERWRAGDAVTLVMDGLPGSHPAQAADQPASAAGPLWWTQAQFDRVADLIHREGLQICTHGSSDAAIHRIVNTYERLRQHGEPLDARHRIERCRSPQTADIRRMADLQIHAALQPAHFAYDAGPSRPARPLPWRSLLNARVPLSFGSDWNAGALNPLYALLAATLRDRGARQAKAEAAETISMAEAIVCHTRGSAAALRMEQEVGSITPGKFADFVIHDRDPMDLTSWWFALTRPLEIGKLDDLVLATFLGGDCVYTRPDYAPRSRRGLFASRAGLTAVTSLLGPR